MKNIILPIIFLAVALQANTDIDILLANLAQNDDLSNQTKKESAGYLKVYTRSDLDRMKIRSLKELIEQIPFIRYRENRTGYTDPFYTPYQPSLSNGIKVFIDDRELIAPFNGNGLQLFGQMGLEFIDHIEIYMGIPSQSFGLSPATITIKCYTKKPEREQTNVVGISAGSYNSNREYIYSANVLSGLSYLIYFSKDDNNFKKIHFNGSTLSKNKHIKNFYGKISKGNLTFDINIAKAKMDNFMGNSFNIDPANTPRVDVNYFYGGIYYSNEENGIKSSINYSTSLAKAFEDSKTILGLYPIPTPPYYFLYHNAFYKLKENVANIKLSKIFKIKNNKLILGLRGRLKDFKVKDAKLDNLTISNTLGYNKEAILSFSGEDNYLINQSNLLTISLLLNKYNENSVVKNYDALSSRVGYIYHAGNFTSKSFAFYGETIPSMKVLYRNRAIYHQNSDPKKTKEIALSTKFIYKTDKFDASLLYGHTITKHDLYFDGSKYVTTKHQNIHDLFSCRYNYNFNYLNKLSFNAWVSFANNKNLQVNRRYKNYGGYISLFNKIGKFNLYNNLVYKKWDGVSRKEWNFNSTITYLYSRNLTLFAKVNNLFDHSLYDNYYSINPLTNTKTYLSPTESIGRSLFLGLEYQF